MAHADPFADTGVTDKKGGDNKDYVHIRVQQRNGKKCLTTVQGLDQSYDYKKILKALKKGEFLSRVQRHFVSALLQYQPACAGSTC